MTSSVRARVPLGQPIAHPIPYQGSKRSLAPTILEYLPADTETLIEPFAGSAAVTLAAVRSGRCRKALICDINEPLVRLWSTIIENPYELAARYADLWEQQLGREQDFYNEIRDEFNASGQPEHFLYLLARCVKAAVRYNSQGEFNQSPDKRRRGAKPTAMSKHITGASMLLRSVSRAICADYRTALAEAGPADVVYLDPPYQGVSGKRDTRYIAGTPTDEFLEELQSLNERGISFVLSYDGRTGNKTYGTPIPAEMGLTHIEVDAGRSSSATLHGRDDRTIESLYLSPPLVGRLMESSTSASSAPDTLF